MLFVKEVLVSFFNSVIKSGDCVIEFDDLVITFDDRKISSENIKAASVPGIIYRYGEVKRHTI